MPHCDIIPQAVRHTFWEQYPKLHVMASPAQLSEAWGAFEAWMSFPSTGVTIESIRNKLCIMLGNQGVVSPPDAGVRFASHCLYEAWHDASELRSAIERQFLQAAREQAGGELRSDDPVNHPHHYTSHPSGVECIEITKHMSFCLGNALKYIWRCDLKRDVIEDLRKAVWYLEQEIAMREAAAAEGAAEGGEK